VLRPEIFTRATDWPSLASAHRNWERGPPKNCNRENLKFCLKFSVLGSITSGLLGVSSRNFFQSTCRVACDKLGTIFGRPASKNLGGPKNWPKFCAISDNFRLWSRISPEWIHISKIRKVVYQLATWTLSSTVSEIRRLKCRKPTIIPTPLLLRLKFGGVSFGVDP